MEGGTNGQTAWGAAAGSCRVRAFRGVPTMQRSRWQSVRSGFFGGEVWWFAGRWWAISAALDGCRG